MQLLARRNEETKLKNILSLLDKGDITEEFDVELIEGLEETKRVSNDIQHQSVLAKQTQADIVQTSERYRAVANRSSLLFFLMNDLSKIHSYYIFSLAAFQQVFFRAIDLVSSDDDPSHVEESAGSNDGDGDGEKKQKQEEEDSIWLGGLFSPQSYITAMRQIMSRKVNVPLDSMTIEASIVLPEEKSREDDAIFATNLWLEGASVEECMLMSAKPRELLSPIPMVKFQAVELSNLEMTTPRGRTRTCTRYQSTTRRREVLSSSSV